MKYATEFRDVYTDG